MPEWHYYSEADHHWRKDFFSSPPERVTAHKATECTYRICEDAYWPMPDGMRAKAIAANPGIGPFAFHVGEYANSWHEVIDGRLFYFVRWPKSIQYGELVYRLHYPLAHIPHAPQKKEWGWIGIQSQHEYL